MESIMAISDLDKPKNPCDQHLGDIESSFWLGVSKEDGGSPDDAQNEADRGCSFDFPPKKRRGRRPLTTNPTEQIRRAENVVEELRTTIRKGIKAYIEIGHALSRRRREIGHGEFCRLFKGEKNQIENPLPMSLRRAELMMQVAADQRVTRHLTKLPTNLDAVVQLTYLSTQEFEDGIASGRIHENLTRREAEAWIRSRSKPGDGGNKLKKTKKVVPADAMKQQHGTEPVLCLGYVDLAITEKVRLAVCTLLDECETANQRVAVFAELQRIATCSSQQPKPWNASRLGAGPEKLET
jgi:hypothetical protein